MTSRPARQLVDRSKFAKDRALPFNLRVEDFALAMQDVYDLLHDLNERLQGAGLPRFEDMLRPAAMSGLFSDLLTANLAKHTRSLTANRHFNGHPDLVVKGQYPNDAVPSGVVDNGLEVKSTRNTTGAVDTHGARDQWMCVFVYGVDAVTEPAINRAPTKFLAVYLEKVTVADFRRNARGISVHVLRRWTRMGWRSSERIPSISISLRGHAQ